MKSEKQKVVSRCTRSVTVDRPVYRITVWRREAVSRVRTVTDRVPTPCAPLRQPCGFLPLRALGCCTTLTAYLVPGYPILGLLANKYAPVSYEGKSSEILQLTVSMVSFRCDSSLWSSMLTVGGVWERIDIPVCYDSFIKLLHMRAHQVRKPSSHRRPSRHYGRPALVRNIQSLQ